MFVFIDVKVNYIYINNQTNKINTHSVVLIQRVFKNTFDAMVENVNAILNTSHDKIVTEWFYYENIIERVTRL